LASLTVSTPLGTYPVSGAGTFEADVFAGAATEVGVETAAGELLLMGVSSNTSVTVSLASTAEALLYYAVGGMWLPSAQQDTVRALLRGVPEVNALEVELRRQLLAGGNPVAAADAGVIAAIEAAHGSLVGHAHTTGLAEAASTAMATGRIFGTVVTLEGGVIRPFDAAASNIIIDPSSARQAGVEVLHNPTGAGVVAQNHHRRPAAVLAYEVAWEDADRVETKVDPPVLVERVEVPSTGQLEILNALIDVVTGDSPWSPVLSPALNLAGHEGASRTHFQLILIGASATDATWPILDDDRFAGFHDEWDDIVLDKSIELFLDELLLPLIEVYGMGSMAKFDAAKLNAMRQRVRIIYDKHLAGLGVYLTRSQLGYANGLRFVIQELVENRTFRLDMMGMVSDALAESDKNKAALDAMERRLSTRASASAIAAAVQVVLVGGDVAKIMYDLAGSPAVVDWSAISAPALFALSPEWASVSRNNSSARFTVLPKGKVTGHHLYRWTTTGTHGEISDLLQDGDSFVTNQKEVWYFHDTPLDIEDTDRDTITVEVFEVEQGVTTLPPGAKPIARMVATVAGEDRNIDSRVELNYGSTPLGMYIDGQRFGCAEMYLRFDAVPGAKSYVAHIRGVGGQGDERNSNQDFRLRGPHHSVFIDPNAQMNGSTVPAGYTTDWNGVCTWKVGDNFASPPYTFSAKYDREEDQFLVHLFTNVDYTGIVKNPVKLAERVPLWYQWLSTAEFEVVVNR
ncbi:MAG TPA: hypothetical protein VFN03_05815, partial [Trueperaceae bacterium]|nr:hypothetical protein [Trueperaceae bacterium]